MKRVLTFVLALAFAVGASAPTVFCSDVGYGQTDLIPLEDLYEETFDTYLKKFYSQDYPTYGVLDLIRDTFKGGLANASGLNDSPWSWALDLVDNASDLGTEVGLWMTGVKIDPNTGKVIYPDDYLTDYAKQQLDTQLKTAPSSSDFFDRDGHTWLAVPYQLLTSSGNVQGTVTRYTVENNWPVEAAGSFYASRVGNNWIVCSWIPKSNYPNGVRAAGTQYTYGLINSYYNYYDSDTASYIQYLDGYITGYKPNISDSFSSRAAAEANFYSSAPPSGDPTWNGSGYYSDHQEAFSINLPSLPSSNWGNLSKYYYTTYGEEIVEGDIDRYYYNIANNYAPYQVSYELPYWLINGSTEVLDFNYSLELPSADLYELPSEFSGGDSVWDSSFSMLGGFGAFILLGFSFGLVSLFFKE